MNDAEQIDAATSTEDDQPSVPLCLNCLKPVSELDHYCPHCDWSVGQLTPYLPYESIWWQAGIWAKLWDRIWFRDIDHIIAKCFYLFMVFMFAPVLLIAIPRVCWLKHQSEAESGDAA